MDTAAGRRIMITVLGLVFVLLSASPAGAHGEDESQEGYLLVQQALAHLAHDTSDEGIDIAMEKVDDTLAAEDQDGVDVAQVERAQQALEDGHIADARTLLQKSIEEALSELPPAAGEQTGTTVVLRELSGTRTPTGEDWTFIAVSVVFVLAGVALAYRFRPSDRVSELRRRLAPSGTTDEAPDENGTP